MVVTVYLMGDLLKTMIYSSFKFIINPSVWMGANQQPQLQSVQHLYQPITNAVPQPSINGNIAIDPKDVHLTQALGIVENLSKHLITQSNNSQIQGETSGIEILPITNVSPIQQTERRHFVDEDIVGNIEDIMHPDGVPTIIGIEANSVNEKYEIIEGSETSKAETPAREDDFEKIATITGSYISNTPDAYIEGVDEVDTEVDSTFTEPLIKSRIS
jgi:hypothetical protein